MRVLKLDPTDCELFHYQLDFEKANFFLKHKDAFKKMWKEQGKTFWLRFLFTFQCNAEVYVIDHPDLDVVLENSGDRVLDFILINIHKNFVEIDETVTSPEKFVENIFMNSKSLRNSLKKNDFAPFTDVKRYLYDIKCFQVFVSNSGNPDDHSEVPALVIHFINVINFAFVSGLCNLLKKWMKESDISESVAKTIDYTLYYWRPLNQWSLKGFEPSCFEKYVSTYWKEDLPKMLLTCKAHELFANHAVVNCCKAYTRDVEAFELHKINALFKPKPILKAIRHVSPNLVYCKEHSDCCIKIQHSDLCLEPYLCTGNLPCTLTCETLSKTNWKKNDVKDFWKKSSIEFFLTGDDKKRSVSTFVESSVTQIETFCPANLESICCPLSSDVADFLYFHTDPIFRNTYTQQKRKEEYRLKLRKKLTHKYAYDSKDPLHLQCMYDRAKRLWLRETANAGFKSLLCSQQSASQAEIVTKMENYNSYKNNLASVAIGTNGIVFGCIVIPSKKNCEIISPKLNNQISSSSSNSKTKSKKKKAKKTSNSSQNVDCVKEVDINVTKHNQSDEFVEKVELKPNVTKHNQSHEVVEKVSKTLLEEKSDNDDDFNTFYNFVNTNESKAVNHDIGTNDTVEKPLTKQNVKYDSEYFIADPSKKGKLKTCAFCQKVEVECKTFKRCSRCKSENLPDQYYYCSRDCQVADWELSHRQMHMQK